MRVEISGTVFICPLQVTGFFWLGFKMLVAALKAPPAISPPGIGLALIMATLSLSFWIQQGSHPSQLSHSLKKENKTGEKNSTVNLVAFPSKLGALSLAIMRTKTLEGGFSKGEVESLSPRKSHVGRQEGGPEDWDTVVMVW